MYNKKRKLNHISKMKYLIVDGKCYELDINERLVVKFPKMACRDMEALLKDLHNFQNESSDKKKAKEDNISSKDIKPKPEIKSSFINEFCNLSSTNSLMEQIPNEFSISNFFDHDFLDNFNCDDDCDSFYFDFFNTDNITSNQLT